MAKPGGNNESEKQILIKRWHDAFRRATDFDAWGQPLEALDIYQRYNNTCILLHFLFLCGMLAQLIACWISYHIS